MEEVSKDAIRIGDLLVATWFNKHSPDCKYALSVTSITDYAVHSRSGAFPWDECTFVRSRIGFVVADDLKVS